MKTNLVIFFYTSCISKNVQAKKRIYMKNNFYTKLLGVSVLPALLVMPAFSETITARQVIDTNTTYTDLVAENIASTTANNGGVFYMQDVPSVYLVFNGDSSFSGNSLNNGGMGGVIGNGWLSSLSGVGYTQGGKIIFNGSANFENNSTNNNNGGGAIFNYGLGNATSPDILFTDSVTFSNNQVTESMNGVYAGGGAINHRNGMIVFAGDANFIGNESASQGGAIMSAGDMIFNGAASFDSNSAGKSGGALAIMGGNTTFAQSATFSNNVASGASAIYIGEAMSSLTFKDSATFSSNTGVGTLLNNSTSATVSFSDGATFSDNTNSLNGSLVNRGNIIGTSGDFIFSNNSGSNGGGLKNSGSVSLDTTGNILFAANQTSSSAGAFDNGGTVTLSASEISFTGNKSASGYGGAIFNAGDLNITGAQNTFQGNIANDTGATKSGGGAIHNRGNTGTATLVIGDADSINRFDSNSSGAYGGAIVARAFDGSGQDSDITINGSTYFNKNTSTLDGGAIWNYVSSSGGTTGTSTIVFNNDVSFTNNTSGGYGGAIYNNDTVTFNGSATFNGNIANGVQNDIHNDGTINLNADSVFKGGITGGGILNIATGATMDIGSSDITQGSIVLDGTMLATLRSGDTAQITVNDDGGFTGTGTLKLSLDKAGIFHVFGNQTFNNIDIVSSIYDLTWSGGDVTATIKSVEDIASQNNITPETARVISSSSESSSVRLNDLSVIFQEKLASGTASDIAAVEEAGAAINPEKNFVAQSASVYTQNALSSLVLDRMMLAGIGRSGGDADVEFGGIWAQGLYNKSKHSSAFNGYTRGIAVGFDRMFTDDLTLGAGYMYSHSDISGATRDTDIDSSSIFIYGHYQPSVWYMDAILNYTMADYHEDGNAFGIGITSDYDVDTFGARVAAGYEFLGGLTPELSLQYMYLDSSDYTNSLGISNKFDNANYLTASLGTRYEFDIYMYNGWIIRPQLRYALKYDLISDHNDIVVTMPGVNSYILSGERLSRIANEVGIGIGMNYMGLEMSLNYDIEAREDYTSQTGRLNFRYEF